MAKHDSSTPGEYTKLNSFEDFTSILGCSFILPLKFSCSSKDSLLNFALLISISSFARKKPYLLECSLFPFHSSISYAIDFKLSRKRIFRSLFCNISHLLTLSQILFICFLLLWLSEQVFYTLFYYICEFFNILLWLFSHINKLGIITYFYFSQTFEES